METHEITVSQDSETTPRASAITDADTNNVILSTKKGIIEMLKAMKEAQQDEDDSGLTTMSKISIGNCLMKHWQ